MKEEELKLLLGSNEDYLKILMASKVLKCYEQINYYFDTLGFELWKMNKALRIRKEFGNLTLELKERIKTKGDIAVSEETIIRLSEQAFSKAQENLGFLISVFPEDIARKVLPIIDCESLSLVGTIRNSRTLILFLNREMELDMTHFSDNNISYELEIEGVGSQNEAQEIITSLSEFEVSFSPQTQSKFSRLVSRQFRGN